jgi:pyruvate dehydrogenase E1 component
MTTQIDVTNPSDLKNEIAEWIEAFDDVIVAEGPEHGGELLAALRHRARSAGIATRGELTTPYTNSIPKHEELPYPGDRELEGRVESLIRWNAMAMVHSQNKKDARHWRPHRDLFFAGDAAWRSVSTTSFMPPIPGKGRDQPGDFIYFQGHASPGVYARAFLEGRFDEERLKNFPPRVARTSRGSRHIRTRG